MYPIGSHPILLSSPFNQSTNYPLCLVLSIPLLSPLLLMPRRRSHVVAGLYSPGLDTSLMADCEFAVILIEVRS